ncbi:uncharacterized protein [Dysidea avara]|uniref:uncharacterized protein isoform X2 n=1 Tax=Dysidea avara TaxID=196820 RepID=UPI00331C243B
MNPFLVFPFVYYLFHYRSNAFSILDGVEATLTALLTLAISMVISIGKAETCDSLRKGYEDYYKESEICANIYLYGVADDGHYVAVRIYYALLACEITSWMAMGVISLIAIISWSRVFSWASREYCSWTPQQPSAHPLQVRPQQSYYRLQNDDYDDDNKPDDYVTNEQFNS